MSKFRRELRRLYGTQRWKRTRRAVFERDGWRCVECDAPGALECDHVLKPHNFGDFFDLANLRTLCRSCHIEKHRHDNDNDQTLRAARREYEDWIREIVEEMRDGSD